MPGSTWTFQPGAYLGLASLQDPRLPAHYHWDLKQVDPITRETSGGGKSLHAAGPDWEEATSGVYVELTCSAMSEGEGVPFMDPNTKVPLLPESALALIFAHTARQVAKPGLKVGSTGEKEALVVPTGMYVVAPPCSGVRARLGLAAAARASGVNPNRIVSHSLASVMGALTRSESESASAFRKVMAKAGGSNAEGEAFVLVVHANSFEVEVSLIRCSGFDRKRANAPGTVSYAGGFQTFTVMDCYGDPHFDVTDSAFATDAVRNALQGAPPTVSLHAALLYVNELADTHPVRQAILEAIPASVVVVPGAPGDGALGGSLLSAADAKQMKSFLPSLSLKDALPYPLALLLTDPSKGEVLPSVSPFLPRLTKFPSAHTRKFEIAKDGVVCITVAQQLPRLYSSPAIFPPSSQTNNLALTSVTLDGDVAWLPAEGEEVSPLSTWSEEEEGWIEVESAVLHVDIDRDGLVNTYISDRGPQTAESLALAGKRKFRRRLWRSVVTMALLFMMLVGPAGYMLLDKYQTAQAAAAKHQDYVLRLEHYYAEVAPEKLVEGGRIALEETLSKYKDKEHILWRKLETKYGIFPKVLPKNKNKSGEKAVFGNKEL